MVILVGDKSRLALEFVPEFGSPRDEDGNLFLYVNGARFGENRHQYSVYGNISHVIKYYKKSKINFPDVFNYSGKLALTAIEALCYYEPDEDNGEVEEFDHPILKSVPSFLDYADDIDGCIFRYVHYAFDSCRLVIIPSGEEIKICIRDDDTEEYQEVISTYEEFYGLWVDLKSEIDKKKLAR